MQRTLNIPPMKNKLVFGLIILFVSTLVHPILAQEVPIKKILFVVTSHNEKGNTGEPTGYYMSEVSHPWQVLIEAGYDIDFVSPQGGSPPVDAFDLNDPTNKAFWENAHYRQKIAKSLKPEAVDPQDYVAIFFAGGHGAMWDFPENKSLDFLTRNIYEQGGVVAAVCHGPAALVNVRLSPGDYLIQGKTLTAFSNEEEQERKLDQVVPFLLEDALIKHGAKFEKASMWENKVCTDQRLITGQNPQSAKGVAEAMLQVLESLQAAG